MRAQSRGGADGDRRASAHLPIAGWEDDAYADAGLPTLPALYAEALDAGVRIMLCQSGMAMTGAEPRDYDERVEAGGMVSLMQTLGEDRLVVV